MGRYRYSHAIRPLQTAIIDSSVILLILNYIIIVVDRVQGHVPSCVTTYVVVCMYDSMYLGNAWQSRFRRCDRQALSLDLHRNVSCPFLFLGKQAIQKR